MIDVLLAFAQITTLTPFRAAAQHLPPAFPSAFAFALVAIAGGLGAAGRYSLDLAVHRLRPKGPAGIAVVNTMASFGMGLLVGWGLAGTATLSASASAPWAHWGPSELPLGVILAAGLLGGFSTFSTVALDSATLLRERRWRWLLFNTAGVFLISVGACLAATGLVQALS